MRITTHKIAVPIVPQAGPHNLFGGFAKDLDHLQTQEKVSLLMMYCKKNIDKKYFQPDLSPHRSSLGVPRATPAPLQSKTEIKLFTSRWKSRMVTYSLHSLEKDLY